MVTFNMMQCMDMCVLTESGKCQVHNHSFAKYKNQPVNQFRNMSFWFSRFCKVWNSAAANSRTCHFDVRGFVMSANRPLLTLRQGVLSVHVCDIWKSTFGPNLQIRLCCFPNTQYYMQSGFLATSNSGAVLRYLEICHLAKSGKSIVDVQCDAMRGSRPLLNLNTVILTPEAVQCPPSCLWTKVWYL